MNGVKQANLNEEMIMDSNPIAPTENLPVESQVSSELEERVIDVLRTCYDPEIPVNIYELGLIYNVDIDSEANVSIRMTLTSPGCPVAGTLPGDVQSKVASVIGVKSATVDLVWDPAWRPDRMSEAAKLQLGMF
jgi:FeS assembly SUF system protein